MDPQRLLDEGIRLTDYEAQHRWLLATMRRLWRLARHDYPTMRYWRVYEFHAGAWDPLRRVENHRIHVHALVENGPPGGGRRCALRNHVECTCPNTYRRDNDPWRPLARAAGLGITLAYSLPTLYEADGAAAELCRNYATKYLSKQKSDAHRYRIRLTAASQGLPPLPTEEGPEMQLVIAPPLRYGHRSAVLAARAGIRLVRRNLGKPGFSFDHDDLLQTEPLDEIAHPLQHGLAPAFHRFPQLDPFL